MGVGRMANGRLSAIPALVSLVGLYARGPLARGFNDHVVLLFGLGRSVAGFVLAACFGAGRSRHLMDLLHLIGCGLASDLEI